jgi:hypothetical protein
MRFGSPTSTFKSCREQTLVNGYAKTNAPWLHMLFSSLPPPLASRSFPRLAFTKHLSVPLPCRSSSIISTVRNNFFSLLGHDQTTGWSAIRSRRGSRWDGVIWFRRSRPEGACPPWRSPGAGPGWQSCRGRSAWRRALGAPCPRHRTCRGRWRRPPRGTDP